MIKIFIATEFGHEKAEKALEYSILSSTNQPVEINWMKNERGEIFSGWNKGRDHNLMNSGEGWKTNFSCYRWVIPELCNFQGRAIYLDVDQLVLKDVSQMWNLDMGDKAVLTIKPEKTDVMLIDCSKFKENWWPRLKWMKSSGKHQLQYRKLIQGKNLIGQLDSIYNCLDGDGFSEETRLVHYTKMNTQPWHPSPESMEYKPHKIPEMEDLWWRYYNEAMRHEERTGKILGCA